MPSWFIRLVNCAFLYSRVDPAVAVTVSCHQTRSMLDRHNTVEEIARQEWRKRVGIEPTAAGVSRQPDGFEGRASHQTRIASPEGLV